VFTIPSIIIFWNAILWNELGNGCVLIILLYIVIFLVHFVELGFYIHSTFGFIKLVKALLFIGNYLSLVELVCLYVKYSPIKVPSSTLMKTSNVLQCNGHIIGTIESSICNEETIILI